jgi:hypothetical protein
MKAFRMSSSFANDGVELGASEGDNEDFKLGVCMGEIIAFVTLSSVAICLKGKSLQLCRILNPSGGDLLENETARRRDLKGESL